MPDMPALPPFDAIIVAAGEGLRAGQHMPKQFATYRGKPLLLHSVEAFSRYGAKGIVVVHPEGAGPRVREMVGDNPRLVLATGGATRQQSVRNGLAALEREGRDAVLIHDAARPGLTGSMIERLLLGLADADGAIPVLPVVDSLVRSDRNIMQAAVDRADLWRVQTPQAFRREAIMSAHAAWTGPPDAGDDAQVLRAAGGRIALVEGDERLKKVTFADDFDSALPPVRVGTGYDVHRLVENEQLWLGGIRIDFHKGLAGHSDADVALHAITDALLGAIAEGDIGTHFPPSDARWKGAASDAFLRYAAMLVEQAGYMPGNIDLTIICEAPKIGPHRAAMRERIAALLGIDVAAVSVKATTTERLGFAGREEGIAAQAVATLIKQP